MSTDVNVWIGEGFVGRDPKITRNGDMLIAETVIAVGKDWKSKQSGQRESKTTWVDIKAYGTIAEFFEKNVVKGSRVWVAGELESDEWEDKTTGAKRSKLRVVVSRVNFGFNPRMAGEFDRKKADVTQSNHTHADGPPQGGYGAGGEIPF